MLLSTSSTTFSSTAVGGQLLLRGTRDGELAATLSPSPHPPSRPSTRRPERVPLFTWAALVDIISSGNLQKLSRHPDDLREYFAWMDSIKTVYGSVSSFLIAERFTATCLLEKPPARVHAEQAQAPKCFQSSFTPGNECQVLVNDWPYSVPSGVTHYVVWSYLPILHPDLMQLHSDVDEDVRASAWSVIAKRGLCGTLSPHTGLRVPSIADHRAHLPDLVSSLPENEVHKTLTTACTHLVGFIQHHWDMHTHEAAFFANPPSLQSVPALAHFHVLVKPL